MTFWIENIERNIDREEEEEKEKRKQKLKQPQLHRQNSTPATRKNKKINIKEYK